MRKILLWDSPTTARTIDGKERHIWDKRPKESAYPKRGKLIDKLYK